MYFQGIGRNILDSMQRAGSCEAEARCLLQHESYVAVRVRQDIKFASGVEGFPSPFPYVSFQDLFS